MPTLGVVSQSNNGPVCFSGSYAGAVVGMPLSGLLTNNFGWPAGFYVFGKCRKYFIANHCANLLKDLNDLVKKEVHVTSYWLPTIPFLAAVTRLEHACTRHTGYLQQKQCVRCIRVIVSYLMSYLAILVVITNIKAQGRITCAIFWC